MNLSDGIVRAIRTLVPIWLGTLILAVNRRFGIDIDSTGVIMVVLPLVITGYYALARLLERRWPWTGYLLGRPKE